MHHFSQLYLFLEAPLSEDWVCNFLPTPTRSLSDSCCGDSQSFRGWGERVRQIASLITLLGNTRSLHHWVPVRRSNNVEPWAQPNQPRRAGFLVEVH